MKYLYRNEELYNSGYRLIKDVLRFELFELGNTDILEYIKDNYKGINIDYNGQNIKESIENGTIDNLEWDYESNNAFKYIEYINNQLNVITGKKLKYCLWLADLKTVKDFYEGTVIDKYKTSEYVLSDLGDDGILFAYEELPLPIKTIENDLII